MKYMEKNNYLGHFVLFGVIALVAAVSVAIWKSARGPGEYDTFANCIAASGARMYGAWWCSHCAAQKRMFGLSWKAFTEEGGYIECSTADKSQTQECSQAGIQSYPTWRFSDESTLTGQLDFATISQKTGCPVQSTSNFIK